VANPSELVMVSKKKLSQFIKDTFWYLLKKIIPTVIVLSLLTLLSFIFTRGLSVLEYSNRIFLVGVAVMTLGGIVIFAQMISSSGKIFFNNDRDPKEIKKILNPDVKSRSEIEHRYNAGGQIWLIGFFCILVSILVTLILG
jgi:hypothetical protein